MTPTEMIHTAVAEQTTPPNSPTSEQIVTLNNVQQFIDMVKAVVAMEIASAPYHTPPTNQSSSHGVTTGHVQQFLDILKSFNAKHGPPLPPAAADKVESEELPARASKLDFKTVNEVYVSSPT